ncbi:MAG: flagellar basal body P-ring formation chaperone FlgA, partial [Campylobacteraceae bacterium]|nr:flagellar basal body P-ring formation chaperone FlgA [Campylobacteraceae bacterium]
LSLLLMLTFLGANDKFFIKNSYCVDNLQKITSSLFTRNKKNEFFISNLPKNVVSYRISSLKIISKFKQNEINITDLSNGIVTFKKCKIPIDLETIKIMLEKKFRKKFRNINIKNIKISPTSNINPNFSFYKIRRLDIKKNYLRRAKGTFGVWISKGNSTKQIYLKYNIDALVTVFKANYNLRNGKILQNNDYIRERIKLKKLPIKILQEDPSNKFIVRGYIRKGAILSMSHFRVKKDILKGNYIKAILKDENLVLEVDAHMLKDANIGDIVPIKTVAGKVFQAKILSLKTAMIME